MTAVLNLETLLKSHLFFYEFPFLLLYLLSRQDPPLSRTMLVFWSNKKNKYLLYLLMLKRP